MRLELKNLHREQQQFRLRLMVAAIFTLICFGLVLSRLFFLQALRYDHYQTLAESNRISLVPIVPNRGLIVDRNGVSMAENFFVYTLELTPSKVDDVEKTITELSKIINISSNDRKLFNKFRAESRNFESAPIRAKLNESEAATFAVNSFRFPGVEIRSRLFRNYPLGTQAAHLIGYIGRINENDVDRLADSGEVSNYKGSDHIGKGGLEQSYEHQLHGITGFQQVEVDADGHAVRVLSSTPPVAGNNLILSIDSKLQKIAEDAFGNHRGALVALNPANGEILAYVSMPSFDPNLFVDGIDTDNWNALNDSLDKPLINRPIRGAYPPGSTIKPFIALAGLENGKRAPPFAISDPGYFVLPGSSHRYRDWKPEGHGRVDVVRAITISCDTFFYGLALDLGIDKLASFLSHFGFGQLTNLDIAGERTGLLPTPEWKEKRFKQPWYAGETVITGIGQGYTLVTPMQLAFATAMLANNGVGVKPHLVASIRDSQTGQIRPQPIQTLERIPVSPENLALVKQGMMGVTQPGGTAASMGAGAGYTIAAKTGTAQVIGIAQNQKYNASQIDEYHRDHGLFIAYAPAEAPRIALAIIVENGGHGGTAAGPIARQVMDYYLLGKMPVKPAEPVVTAAPKVPPEETTND
ncbi:MAG TPA: penicillin-binding protein 2 [Methylophilaceae bacterium]